jgi:hypothetical protein
MPELEPLKVIACQFVDAAGKPIEGMDVSISAGSNTTEHVTNDQGFIPSISLEPSDTVKVAVKKTTGEWKPISEIKPTAPLTHARFGSPKLKFSSELRVHEGPAQIAKTDKPMPRDIGTVASTRSENGHPVQTVALECPNPQNLKLGDNFKYRDIILDASLRSKLSPQSIAAIMNAEAAVLAIKTTLPVIDKKTGKQKLGKDGKPKFVTTSKKTEEWDPHSSNPKSSARGMTQFLDATWISMALTAGTYLNERVQKEGWLTIANNTVKKGKIFVKKSYPAFKLQDGTLVTASRNRGLDRVLSSRPYITAYATASDKNIQALLDLRYDPKYAIHTAVDYGTQNLKGLAAKGFKVDSVSDAEKAKLIYLTHHLGLDDASAFIKNTMSENHAKYLLNQQMSEASAEERAEKHGGSYLKAHREWLSNFVDDRIDVLKKMCNRNVDAPRDLIGVTVAIR